MLNYQPVRTFHDLGGRGEPPLPRWREPKFGEPAHGFLVRLAELNKHSDSSTICRTFGLTPRGLNPAECLDFCLSLPISGAADLIRATPRFAVDSVELMGQQFRKRQWRCIRRFCPACLADEPYHHAWWDLRPFRVCPFHGAPITSLDSAGKPVTWNRASFSISSEAAPICAHGDGRFLEPRPSLESYILGRLNVIAPIGVPLLDQEMQLGEAIAITQYIGRLALMPGANASGLGDDNVDIEAAINDAGFGLLCQGESGLVDLMSRIVDSRERQTDGAGLESAFGPLYAKAISLETRTSFRPITGAMRKAVAAKGLQVAYSKLPFDGDPSSEWMPVSALADELGLTRAKTVELIDDMKLADSCTTRNGALNCISRDNAKLVRKTVAELVSEHEAAKLLGLSMPFFRALVDAEVFAPFAKIYAYGRAARRYHPKQLLDAARKFLNGVVVFDEVPPTGRSLSSFKSKYDPYAQTFIGLLAAGLPFVMGRVGDNLGGLIVPRSITDIGKKLTFWASTPGISRSTAATEVSVRRTIIDALVEAGHLSFIECDAPQPRLDAAAVRAFAEKWAPAKIYAPLGNMTFAAWYNEISRSDIRTLSVPEFSGEHAHRCVFVARDDLEKLRAYYPDLFQKPDAIELGNMIKEKMSGAAGLQITKTTPNAVSILANDRIYQIEMRLDQNVIKLSRRAKLNSETGRALERRQGDIAKLFPGQLQVKRSVDSIEMFYEISANAAQSRLELSALASEIYERFADFSWAVA